MSDAGESRAIRLFVQSGFAWQLCWSSYWTLFFLRVVVDVGLSPFQLLMLGTAKELTILAVEIPTGVVADIKSRRLSVILAFFICGVSIIGAGLASSFWPLVATQMAWAFGSTFRSGAEAAWLTDEVGSLETVDAVLPRRGRFEAAGSIIGLLSMAVLASFAGLTVALVVIGSMLVAWGAHLIVRMEETGFEPNPESSPTRRFRRLFGEGLDAARRPGLRVLLVAAVLAGFASEAVDRLAVARLDETGLQETTIDPALLFGSASVLQSIGTMAVLALVGSRLAGKGLVAALSTLHVLTAVGVAVLARGGWLALALAGFVAQGTMRSIARTVTVGWTNHFTTKQNRATVHSFTGQAGSLGEISGGIGLGLVAQQVGLSAAITASALIYLVAASVASLGRGRWAA